MERQQYQSLSAGAKLWLMGRFAWTQKPWGALTWLSFWASLFFFMGPILAQSLRWSSGLYDAIGVEKGSKSERELLNFLKLTHQIEGHQAHAETYQELAKKSSSHSKIWIPEWTLREWMASPMPASFAVARGVAAMNSLKKEGQSPAESFSPEELSTWSAQSAQESTAQWNAHRDRVTSFFPIQKCPYLQSLKVSTPWASPEKTSSACSLVANASWLGKLAIFAIGVLFICLFLSIGMLVCALHEIDPKFATWAIKLQASFKTWVESRGEGELAYLEGLKFSMSTKRARSGKSMRRGGRL